jgi:hypothetical protein
VAPRVSSQRTVIHPLGACPLYFGIGSAVLGRQQRTPADCYERIVDTIV